VNSAAAGQGAWSQVEKVASYCLLAVLAAVLVTRLSLAGMWALPRLDLALTWAALVMVTASLWFARRSRRLRFWAIGLASATQLVPMTVRQPALLFPLLGAAVPVAILIGALAALSRKGAPRAGPRPRS